MVGGGDPLLGALRGNGGLGETRLPEAGQPGARPHPAGRLRLRAVRATCSRASSTSTGSSRTVSRSAATDQRGVPRPQGPACDVGAVEVTK